MQLTLEIPEQHVPFFKDLVKHLSFPVVVEDDEVEEPTPEQLKAELRQSIQELKLAKEGKLKVKTLTEFLDEL